MNASRVLRIIRSQRHLAMKAVCAERHFRPRQFEMVHTEKVSQLLDDAAGGFAVFIPLIQRQRFGFDFCVAHY